MHLPDILHDTRARVFLPVYHFDNLIQDALGGVLILDRAYSRHPRSRRQAAFERL